MLYVSRILGIGSYGVVDTDDYVEEQVAWGKLVECCIFLGMDIKGCVLGENDGGKFIQSVHPYQDERYVSRLIVKTKAMLGVEITVYEDVIVNILIDGAIMPKGTTIRLSEYASSIDRYAGIGWTRFENRRDPVVFVLDDNIDFSKLSFKQALTDILYDISDVTNESAIVNVYMELLDMAFTLNIKFADRIIDKQHRSDKWSILRSLEMNKETGKPFRSMLAETTSDKEVVKCLEKWYLEEFELVAKWDFDIESLVAVYAKDYVDLVRNEEHERPFTLADYERLRSSYIVVFLFLRMSSNLSYNTLKRFENCIRYFDVEDDIKELYIKLCNNVVKGVKIYCKAKMIFL